MAAQTNIKKQTIEEGDALRGTSEHPVIQGLVKIEDLISGGSNQKTIMEAVRIYSENLTRHGYLNEAEKGVVALARDRIDGILTRHEGGGLAGPITSELKHAKVKLTEHIDNTKKTEQDEKLSEDLKELMEKYEAAVKDGNAIAADICWQDIFKVDPEVAETLKPGLDEMKKKFSEEQKAAFGASTPGPVKLSLVPKEPETPPSVPGAPQAAPEEQPIELTTTKAEFVIQKRIEKASDKEKIFLGAVLQYIQKKPEEQAIILHTMQLLEIDATGDPECLKLQQEIKSRMDAVQYTIDEKTNTIAETHIKSYFENHLKKLQPEIDRILNKYKESAQAIESAPSAPLPAPDTNEPKTDNAPKQPAEEGETSENEEGGEVTSEQAVKETKEAGDKEKEVHEMLKNFIRNEKLISKDNPVCLALVTLVKEKNIDMEELTMCLQNPERYFKDSDTLDVTTSKKELRKKVKAEMRRQKVTTEEDLVQKLAEEKIKLKKDEEDLVAEATSLQVSIDVLKPRTTEKDNKVIIDPKNQEKLDKNLVDFDKNQKKQVKIKQRNRDIEAFTSAAVTLDELKVSKMKYDSPRDVLSVALLFTYEKDKVDIEDIHGDMEKRIKNARETTDKWDKRLLRRWTSFLKPTLKSTLMAIGKDAEFKSIVKEGEDPSAKLAELAKFNLLYGSTEINNWLKDIYGKNDEHKEKHMETTIPRLIAYLESAIREGKSTSLIKTKRAKIIVEHLRKVQHDYYRESINNDEKFKNKPREKMLAYINKLKVNSQREKEMDRKLIRYNVYKSVALRSILAPLGITAGVATATASLPLLAGAAAALGITGIRASYMKNLPTTKEETRKGLRRGATRVLVASVLGAGLGVVALPLGITFAAVGAGYPELFRIFRKKPKETSKETSKK